MCTSDLAGGAARCLSWAMGSGQSPGPGRGCPHCLRPLPRVTRIEPATQPRQPFRGLGFLAPGLASCSWSGLGDHCAPLSTLSQLLNINEGPGCEGGTSQRFLFCEYCWGPACGVGLRRGAPWPGTRRGGLGRALWAARGGGEAAGSHCSASARVTGESVSSGPIPTCSSLLPLLAVSSIWYNFWHFWSGRSF